MTKLLYALLGAVIALLPITAQAQSNDPAPGGQTVPRVGLTCLNSSGQAVALFSALGVWQCAGAALPVSGSFAAGAFAAGSLGVGAAVDGWDLTQGAKGDTAYAGSGSASVVAILKGIYAALVAPLPAGTNVLGSVLIGSTGIAGDAAITSGGTAQNLFSAATPTNGYEVCNPDNTEDAWISDSATAAANGQGSYRAATNGGCYTTPPGYKPVGAVSVVAATTGHKLTARRW